MKRPLFLLLFSLPFLLVTIIKEEPLYFFLAILYLWLIQFSRLLYVGVSWRKALLAFTPFGISYWMKMWQMDSFKDKLA